MDYIAVCAERLTIIDVTNPAVPTYADSIDTLALFGATPYFARVNGNYLYIGLIGGTIHIYDISSLPPILVGNFGPIANGPFDMFIDGAYAYVSHNIAFVPLAISIFDITNPILPVLVGTYLGPIGSYATKLFKNGNLLYATEISGGWGTLEIIDVTNPAAPVLAGFITTPIWSTQPIDVSVQGNFAFVSSLNGANLTTIDVTIPAAPAYVFDLAGMFANPHYFKIRGNHAFLCSFNWGPVDTGVNVIDISNPAATFVAGLIVGSGAPNFLADANDIILRGNMAYVAASTDDSLTVIDISNPVLPTFVANIMGLGAPNFLGGASSLSGVFTIAPPPPPPPPAAALRINRSYALSREEL